MRLRHATALAAVPVSALALAGCVATPADPPEPERGPAALTVEVLLAAVSQSDDAECPADDPHAFDSSFVDTNDDETAQCTFVDPDLQLTIARGEVDFLEQGEQGLSQDGILLSVDAADQEAFEALTTRLSELGAPQNRMAVIVDDEVLTTPTVMAPLTGGERQFVGGDDVERIYDTLTG